MDNLPREILVHILTFANDPDASKNCRSTCKKLHQFLVAERSIFSLKAMPVSALESLVTILRRSNKRIALKVGTPTLAIREVPNKFMNALTSLTNLTGLDLSAWTYFPGGALTKILQMTQLEQLSTRYISINFSPLVNLSKLTSDVVKYPRMWDPFTNLQDLKLPSTVPSIIEELPKLSQLTRLHFGFTSVSTLVVTLTTLSNLKDLSISPLYSAQARIKLIASCTTLESLDIDYYVDDVDVDWIVSNTRLTRFHVGCDYEDSPKFHPLTRLRNISSAKFMSDHQPRLFSKLRLTKLQVEQPIHKDFYEIINYTALESLEGISYHSCDIPNSLVKLTRLIWKVSSNSTISTGVPTTVKELGIASHVKNLQQLTRLESMMLRDPVVSSWQFDVSRSLKHLTKIDFWFKGAQQALAILPKLSNLFSLKELSVYTPNNYQGLDSNFLTTLTNLDMLDMPSINISLQVFDKIVQKYTQLTQLRVNCSTSSGETLTRLTNLQILHFYSSKPMKGLKMLLEEKLPRLVEVLI